MLSKNAMFHKRTKHIDTRYHYIRELINVGEIIMEQCRTTKQFIDILTKPLGTRLFKQQRDNLGINKKEVENLLRLRGSVENSNLNRWVPCVNKVEPACQQGKGHTNTSPELGAQVAHIIIKKVTTLFGVMSSFLKSGVPRTDITCKNLWLPLLFFFDFIIHLPAFNQCQNMDPPPAYVTSLNSWPSLFFIFSCVSLASSTSPL